MEPPLRRLGALGALVVSVGFAGICVTGAVLTARDQASIRPGAALLSALARVHVDAVDAGSLDTGVYHRVACQFLRSSPGSLPPDPAETKDRHMQRPCLCIHSGDGRPPCQSQRP